jgi:hypothetical protein
MNRLAARQAQSRAEGGFKAGEHDIFDQETS